MIIEDIVKSVQTMSTEEIMERIREIRNSRSVVKEVTATKRPTKTASKTEQALTDTLKGLSDEDKQLLLQLLGGK